jgi:hypothetical protein
VEHGGTEFDSEYPACVRQSTAKTLSTHANHLGSLLLFGALEDDVHRGVWQGLDEFGFWKGPVHCPVVGNEGGEQIARKESKVVNAVVRARHAQESTWGGCDALESSLHLRYFASHFFKTLGRERGPILA